jgi:hypothetical protein
MSKGFVTFSDERFLPLVEVLAESLLTFSKYSLHVFLIDCNKKLDFKNVIITQIILPEGWRLQQIMFSKLYAAANNDFDFGCILDADMIANYNVDELLFFAEKECDNFPLLATHGSGVVDLSLMKFLGVKKQTMPYCHATYLFSKNSKKFLRECYEESQKIIKSGFINKDEELINCMLWRYGCRRYVNAYSPHYILFDDYISDKVGPNEWIKETGEMSFHLFHGCKDENIALNILDRLKNRDLKNGGINNFRNKQMEVFTSSI